jgi:hypothetical protein
MPSKVVNGILLMMMSKDVGNTMPDLKSPEFTHLVSLK